MSTWISLHAHGFAHVHHIIDDNDTNLHAHDSERRETSGARSNDIGPIGFVKSSDIYIPLAIIL